VESGRNLETTRAISLSHGTITEGASTSAYLQALPRLVCQEFDFLEWREWWSHSIRSSYGKAWCKL